jgi:hypothetical protein
LAGKHTLAAYQAPADDFLFLEEKKIFAYLLSFTVKILIFSLTTPLVLHRGRHPAEVFPSLSPLTPEPVRRALSARLLR